jgi:Domain of unknown function (DUF4157)
MKTAAVKDIKQVRYPTIPSRLATTTSLRTVTHTEQLPFQKTLTISSAGVRYEAEADRVAEQVVGMNQPRLQQRVLGSTPAVQCQSESVVAAHDVPLAVHQALKSPGQPLDAATRAFMEPRFGHDFAKVRVYADHRAAESAQTLNALAYTVAPNIVFGAGHYAPQTDTGRRLLAHELTHVVQQANGHQHFIQRQGNGKHTTPTGDEMLHEILCGRGGGGLFGRTKLNEIFRFSGTFFTNPQEVSSAEIEDLRTGKRDLYYIGDWLNDEWQIVDIGLNDVTVVSATCGTEEILGREAGGAPQSSEPSLPNEHVEVEVSKGTLGRGKVNISNGCKRVEFIPDDSSKPSRVYLFDEGISEYVLEGDKNSTFTPLRLAKIVGVRLLEYENGKLHAGNCGKPYGALPTNMK